MDLIYARTACNIHIYAFSRRFYPKQLTVHSGYTFFVSMCGTHWELNPQPFALLTQCSTTEPQEHTKEKAKHEIASYDPFNTCLLNKSMYFFKTND